MDGMLNSNTIVFSTDSRDLLNIANEAKEAEYLSGYVDWLTIAYEKARHENKTEKYTKRIRYVSLVKMISFKVSIKNYFRKYIKRAKQEHDSRYLEDEWDLRFFSEPPKTNEFQYFPTEKTKYVEELRKKESNHFNTFMGNLIPTERNWGGHDVAIRMDLLQRIRMQKLCKGTVSLEVLKTKQSSCTMLQKLS